MNIEFSTFDIKYATDVKEIEMSIMDWKPIKIKFGFYQVSEKKYILWQVFNTTHTFAVPLDFINENNKGNYINHFEKTLIKFRTDLLSWISEGLTEDWMKKYYYDFMGLIYL